MWDEDEKIFVFLNYKCFVYIFRMIIILYRVKLYNFLFYIIVIFLIFFMWVKEKYNIYMDINELLGNYVKIKVFFNCINIVN